MRLGRVVQSVPYNDSHKSQKAYCAVSSSPFTRNSSTLCQTSSRLRPRPTSSSRRRASEMSMSSRHAESFMASNCSMDGERASMPGAWSLEYNFSLADADQIPFRTVIQPVFRPFEFFCNLLCHFSNQARFARLENYRVHIAGGEARVETKNHHRAANQRQLNVKSLRLSEFAETLQPCFDFSSRERCHAGILPHPVRILGFGGVGQSADFVADSRTGTDDRCADGSPFRHSLRSKRKASGCESFCARNATTILTDYQGCEMSRQNQWVILVEI